MYIELHAASAFSFLRGGSLPETLVERAAALGYPALALLDADGVYGAPRFHKAAKQAGLRAIIGAELTIDSGFGARDPGLGARASGLGPRGSGLGARGSEVGRGLLGGPGSCRLALGGSKDPPLRQVEASGRDESLDPPGH
jgi:hypothetical protein